MPELLDKGAVQAHYDPNKPLINMHIPKCAGTSVSLALQKALKPERPHIGIGPLLFGGFNDFESMPASTRSMIFLTRDFLRVDADYVGGHLDYRFLKSVYGTNQYITLLREPVTRILSNWLFWRAWPWSSPNYWGTWSETVLRSRGSLKEFLRDPVCCTNTDNVITRMLVGIDTFSPVDQFLNEIDDAELLKIAAEKLKEFAYVDFIENTAMFANLTKWLGIPVEKMVVNVMPNLAKGIMLDLLSELDLEAHELLTHRTRLDRVLWEQVVTTNGYTPETCRRAAQMELAVRYKIDR